MSENKRLARLEALIVTERKKQDAAERKHSTEQISNRKLKSDLKANKAEHDIALELVKTKLAEHEARGVAELATKLEKLKASLVTSNDLLASKVASLKASKKNGLSSARTSRRRASASKRLWTILRNSKQQLMNAKIKVNK